MEILWQYILAALKLSELDFCKISVIKFSHNLAEFCRNKMDILFMTYSVFKCQTVLPSVQQSSIRFSKCVQKEPSQTFDPG